jgi:hypothetical protein
MEMYMFRPLQILYDRQINLKSLRHYVRYANIQTRTM